MVEEYIDNTDDKTGVALIDGYPKEPELLPLIYKASGAKFMLRGCVSIEVSDEVAIQRQLARPPEDGDGHPAYGYNTALRRVTEHNAQTEVVIAALGQLYGLEAISGEQDFPQVASDFIGALGRIMLPRAVALAPTSAGDC